MAVKREKITAPGGGDFRIRQLRARDMLRGDLEGEQLEKYVEERVLTTTVDLGKVGVSRTHWPFLRDRRIDAYQDITKRYLD